MKFKGDLNNSDFKKGYDGWWYMDLNCVEKNELEQQAYLIVNEDKEVLLQTQIEPIKDYTKGQWQDEIYELPKALIQMIKDGVIDDE